MYDDLIKFSKKFFIIKEDNILWISFILFKNAAYKKR